MMCRDDLRREAARTTHSRSARPNLECLEERQMLSTASMPEWSHASRITYSFMPDGTSIGGIPSNLYQTLNSKFATTAWQQAFQKAAAIWQQVANINLALVPDNGAPVGGSGDQQGDPRYGDIRIGAYPQTANQLALTCLPPPVNGGSDAGDIFINSQVAWKLNNDYDLETVAIHELGHALGLGHSSIQAADMYASYTGMKQSLNAADTSAIQGVYGGVPSRSSNNSAAGTAIDLTPYLNSQGQIALGGQSIGSVAEYDWFKVTVPASTTGTMVVTMQSSSLSSLSPRLAVFNSSMASVGQSLAANSYGSTVSMTVPNVKPGEVYYLRFSAANGGASSNGAYGIEVNLGSSSMGPVAPPYTTVTAQPDQGGGSSAEQTGNTISNAGLLGLGLSLRGGLSLDVNLLGLDIAVKVQIGTLSVYAEALKAGKPVAHPGHRHAGSGGHAHPIHRHGHHPAVPAD